MIDATVRAGGDPAPSNIGLSDVKEVEAATSSMRALDYQFGGGACRDAVIAHLSWAQRLLGASGKEKVRLRLFRALGDLHNLAGWTIFDVGLLDSSRSYFAFALEFAKQSGDSGLMSNIMYRIGRVSAPRRRQRRTPVVPAGPDRRTGLGLGTGCRGAVRQRGLGIRDDGLTL
jgi:hypothetical protein